MAKARILVVDDEEHIAELLRVNLEEEGYLVETAASGEEALLAVRRERPDLIVLDLMLPGIQGAEVCRELRRDLRMRRIPIIMLTAKGEEQNIVEGIESGADDYITKPFSPSVLCARVGMVFRRLKKLEAAKFETPDDAIKHRALEIDPGNHQILVRGRPVALTSGEFRIIHFMAKHPGRVFTRNQLVEAMHGDEVVVTERTIDVRMFGLRKKLGETAGRYIETVRGVGYRLRT